MKAAEHCPTRMGQGSGRWVAVVLGILLSASSTGAATAQKAPRPPPPTTPTVAKVHILKNAHRMDLLTKDGALVASYRVAIGPGGTGNKHREGDKVTPIGRYHVISRNPSDFKIFMRLDYPNADDRARFARLKADGTLPKWATIGGDIGIHGGTPPGYATGEAEHDWTLGCISVEDAEIVAIAPQVKDGTVVEIED